MDVISGDYSVIKNPTNNAAMQLDIYIPEIKLAIEYNGEYWHDRKKYEKDKQYGTLFTREALKDKLCANKNITLINVWSSDWKLARGEEIDKIVKAVRFLRDS